MADSSYVQKISDPLFLTDDSIGGIDVATDPKGNFVVTWATDSRIQFQRYKANGVPNGDRVTLATPNNASPSSPAIAMNPKGEFVITYDLIDPQGGDREIDAQMFNATGERKGDVVLVSNNEIDDRNPDVALANNGRFLITWERYNNGDRSNIALNDYDAKGKLIDTDEVTNSNLDSYAPVISIIPGNASGNNVSGILSFSQDSGSSQDGADVLYQVLRGRDYSGGNFDNVLSNPQGDQGQSAVGIDNKGNAVIAWTDRFSGNENNVYLIKRAANGAITNNNVSQDVNKDDNSPTVTVATNGNFFVGYTAQTDEQIKLQEFNSSAKAVNNPITTDKLQSNPSVAITPDAKNLILAGVDQDNKGGVLLYGKSGSAGEQQNNIGVDLNQDGKSDILWRNLNNGENKAWLMDGLNVKSEEFLEPESNQDWYVGGVGDFNNDGKDDLIWANQATRAVGVWYMDGVNRSGTGTLPRLSSRDLRVQGVADFNGDGNDDLFVRNQKNGANQIWYMEGTNRIRAVNVKGQNKRFDVGGLADFNNDNKPDLVWRDQRSGKNQVWLMNNNSLIRNVNIETERNRNAYIGGTGDFNLDGKADLIFGNRVTGNNEVWFMNSFENNKISLIDKAPIRSESNLDWQIVNG